MQRYAQMLPVVQTRTLEFPIVDAKTERLDQMQLTTRRGAQPRNVSGVRRNFRLDQCDMQRYVGAYGSDNAILRLHEANVLRVYDFDEV
jgi:hypothetical protein